MTEEEAKTKWCPMVRHEADSDGGGSWNRGYKDAINATRNDPGYLCNCIASECMMWREFSMREAVNGQRGGYCGLGGKS